MNAADVRVEEFAGAPGEWDRFVRSRPTGTHGHLWGWRGVMEDGLGHSTTYLSARRPSGALAGVLPLVRVRSLLFGDYLVSMPFLNYGGPLGDEDGVRALAQRATTLADEMGVRLLELRSRDRLPLDMPASHRKVTVVLPLVPGDPDAVFARLASKVRSQVRRPLKAEVEFRFGVDQLGPFYRVFARHMRDLGTPVLGRRFFEAVAGAFGDSAWFGCAWLKGRPVAAGCGLVCGPEVEMTWASALRSHSRSAANMLVYWRFMERAAKEGLGRFNFGRCTPGAGTHRFKRQWGGEDETLWWYHRPVDAGRVTPNPEGGVLAAGPRIWRRLPLGLANLLGPRIVRFLP